jgi:endonuclease YncB( thermonuclease family)
MNKIVPVFLLSVFAGSLAFAQEAPPPRKMPRTPVSASSLEHEGIPASRELQGQAVIMDGERLRIGKADMRLFGIVPPQLSASFGPQARAFLDALANGQNLTCRVRDRDRDARLLATCMTGNGTDLALELLKRGLAVAARGSLVGTELAPSYTAAEQAAQTQKIGLWSLSQSAPAHTKEPKPEVKQEAKQEPKQEPAAAPVEEKKPEEAKKDDKALAAQMQEKITADILAQQAEAQSEDMPEAVSEAGIFERYQILISGFLVLGTALCIMAAMSLQRIREKRDELRALAAALRGELTAARSVCAGRAKAIADEEDDKAASWPRIRTILYSAYVGRLGMLGADLARRIASIYGQSADYAALYNPTTNSGTIHDAPKKHALETLIRHIDEVLPRLAEIERSGKLHGGGRHTVAQPVLQNHIHTTVSAEPAASMAPINLTEAEVISPVIVPPMPKRTAADVAMDVLYSARSFIGTVCTRQSATVSPVDPAVAEYTAIIEADMERYQQAQTVETFEIAVPKKQTK